MKRCITTIVIALLIVHASAAAQPPAQANSAATLNGDAKRPAAARWIRTELYFGTGLVDSPRAALSEEDWRAFLDREVTPRFPDGFTVPGAGGFAPACDPSIASKMPFRKIWPPAESDP